MLPTETPIERAIRACENQQELGRRIGRSQQVISYWKKRGVIPAEAVPDVERATCIPRHELRPDIFEAAS